MSLNLGEGLDKGAFERSQSSSCLRAPAQLTPLWKGSFLLKHGRQGRPKVHYFQLSDDSMELVWTRASGTRRSVPLSRVQDILLGQASPVFRRFPLKEDACSFSLVYDTSTHSNAGGSTNHSSRTLDVTFLNKAQRDVWYQGLVEATRYAHQVMVQGRPQSIRRDLGDMMMWGNVNFFGDDTLTFTNKAASSHQEYQGLEAMLPAGNTLPFSTSHSSSLPQSSIPLLIPSNNLLNIEKACLGHRHGVIQSAEGCVYSFGEGKNGKLGLGHDDDVSHPRKIEYGFDTLSSIVDVHLSNESSLAVTQDGRLFAWGKVASPIPSLLNSGVFSRIKISSISCGPYHCGGICDQGRLYTWGEGLAGKLGHGDVQSRAQPTLVVDLPGVVQKVACGLWHSAAIVRIQSEDSHSQGQADVEEVQRSPHHRHRRTLSHISGTFGTILNPDATIDCYREGRGGYLFTWGGAHAPCLQGQGGAFCENNKGCLGHGEDSIYSGELAPRIVKGPLEGDSVKDVAAGSNFTAVISTAGAVYQMGSMGCIIQQSTSSNTPHPWEGAYSPVAVRGLLSNVYVDKIDCGLHHVVVAGRPFDRKSARPVDEVSSLVFTWGRGREGQLGQGKLEDSVFPVMIEALKSRHISSVACGSFCSSIVCKQNTKKIVSDFSRDAWDTASRYYNTLMERSNPLQGLHSHVEKTSGALHETESFGRRSLDLSSRDSFSRDSLHASLSRPSKSVISVSETSQSGDVRVRRSIGQFASHHSLNSFSESWEAPSRYQSSSFRPQESSNSVEYTPARWKKKIKSEISRDAQDTASSMARPHYSRDSTLESEKATLQEEKYVLSQWAQELKDKEERLLTRGDANQTIPEGSPSSSYCWTEELDQGVSATFTMKNGKQKLLRIRFSRDMFSPADVALWYELHQDSILTCTSPKYTKEADVSVTQANSISEAIRHVHFSRKNMSFDAHELVRYHQTMQHLPCPPAETKDDDDDATFLSDRAEVESLVSAVSHPSQLSDTDEIDTKTSMASSVANALWQLSLKAFSWTGQSHRSKSTPTT